MFYVACKRPIKKYMYWVEKKWKVTKINFFLIQLKFSYCHLIWMFLSKVATCRINTVYEKSVQLIFQDYDSIFDKLLQYFSEISTPQACIHSLITVFSGFFYYHLAVQWPTLNSSQADSFTNPMLISNLTRRSLGTS